MSRQRIAKKLANGFAAGGKAPFLAVAVKLLEQVRFQRHGKTHEIGHKHSPRTEPQVGSSAVNVTVDPFLPPLSNRPYPTLWLSPCEPPGLLVLQIGVS